MGDDAAEKAATFKAVGAGGVEWEFDVPAPGSFREDNFRSQIAKGELTVIGDSPFPPLEDPGPVTGSEQVEDGAPVPPVIAGTVQVGAADQPPENVIPGSQEEPLAAHVAAKVAETGAAMTSAAPSSAGSGVPDGNIEAVVGWVDDTDDDDEHRARAQAALDAEQAKGEQARSTLVAQLEQILDV